MIMAAVPARALTDSETGTPGINGNPGTNGGPATASAISTDQTHNKRQPPWRGGTECHEPFVGDRCRDRHFSECR